MFSKTHKIDFLTNEAVLNNVFVLIEQQHRMAIVFTSFYFNNKKNSLAVVTTYKRVVLIDCGNNNR